MQPDKLEETVTRLRALVDQDAQKAMDDLESLVRRSSVRELDEILRAVFVEISEKTGIDWHFTALQWKLGNGTRDQFLGISRQAWFTVWSLPFQGEGDSGSEMRYTTSLPFSFKLAWMPCDASSPRTETLTRSDLSLREHLRGGKAEWHGGRYRI